MLSFRLYLDGQYLEIPKPVVIDEINPRHTTQAASGIYTTNSGDLDFEHVMLNKNVIIYYNFVFITALIANIKELNTIVYN